MPCWTKVLCFSPASCASFHAVPVYNCRVVTETAFPAGYRLLDQPEDAAGKIDLWYPASSSAHERVLNYRMGSRGLAAPDAPPLQGPMPVVVLSSGDFGAPVGYSWVGESLARRGFIVAGTGPTPRDCSAALDAVLAEAEFQSAADPGRIAAIGHSAGGAAVIALAGAILDARAMAEYCGSRAAQGDRACPEGMPAHAGLTLRDERVRAVVAMDPTGGPGHDARSLSLIRIPVLIVGSVDNDYAPFAHHAGRYARLIPGASLNPLAHGEGHFVFVDECSGEVTAQGVSVCRDRAGVRRASVHAWLAEKIARFLKEALSEGR